MNPKKISVTRGNIRREGVAWLTSDNRVIPAHITTNAEGDPVLTEQTGRAIIKQLKVANVHLSMLSGLIIEPSDLE